MSLPPDAPPPRRPPTWAWAVPILSGAAGFSVEVLANQISNTHWTIWPAAVVLVGAGLVLLYLQIVRGRRGREQGGGEPPPLVPASPEPGSTTLPYTSGFTGRSRDVEQIVERLTTEHAVAVVGRRGVGTSSCAVQAANDIRDTATRDKIYYLDLRPGGRPRGARWMLAELAWAVGTAQPRSGRPAALKEAADALRERLDDEHILVVLDNVDSPDQVAPLLPPTSKCRLLLAGASAVGEMEGVAPQWLVEPDIGDAVTMFAEAGPQDAGPRRGPDPREDRAVPEIIELCGRRPRAIRALGYRMALHGWRSTDVLAALHAAVDAPAHHRVRLADPLIPLTDQDVAYRALSPDARRLFRLLSLAPAPVDRQAIGALARRSGPRLDRLLDELARARLTKGEGGDRYRVEPLLLASARLHLRREEPVGRRVAAQTRLLRMLARRAERHVANLAVIGLRVAGTAPIPGRDNGLSLDGDPYGWFGLHHTLLRALVERTPGTGRPMPRRLRRCWFRVAVALAGWYAHEGKLDEWAAVCRAVLAAPTADDRPEIAGWAHNELGVLRRRSGDAQGAAAALTLALAERGRRGTAQAQMNLGLALLDLGMVDDAIEHLELARRHRAHADRGGQALTDLALGAAYLARNEPELAHHYFVRAANTFSTLGEYRGFAAALTNLVLAQARLGEHLDAAQSWTAALHEYEGLKDPIGHAAALLNAGAATITSSPLRARQAYELLARGRELRESRREDSGLGRTLLYLGDAANLLDEPEEARKHWAQAVRVCAAVADAAGEAAARRRLAASPDA